MILRRQLKNLAVYSREERPKRLARLRLLAVVA